MITLDFESVRQETNSVVGINVSYDPLTDRFSDWFIEDLASDQELSEEDLLPEDVLFFIEAARKELA